MSDSYQNQNKKCLVTDNNDTSVSSNINLYQPSTANIGDLQTIDNQITNDSRWYQMSGRIGRVRYLGYVTVVALTTYVTAVFLVVMNFSMLPDSTSASMSNGIAMLLTLMLLSPLLPFVFYATIVCPKRRLHDLNLSGWYVLLMLIPLVNFIFTLYLIFAPGSQGSNQYGYPPRPNRTVHYFGAFVFIVLISIVTIRTAIAIPVLKDFNQYATQLIY